METTQGTLYKATTTHSSVKKEKQVKPSRYIPVGDGFQKALCSLITCGCDNRLRMLSSRSTFRALPGLEATFDILFRATCTPSIR